MMSRRTFVQKSSAGFVFTLIVPGIWVGTSTKYKKTKFAFRKIKEGATIAPILQVTPDDGFYVHTYYDVCPFSPSGRYLLTSRLPYQEKVPVYGDTADVCIVDLDNETIQIVYSTKCWGHQTGTLAQWGGSDRFVYTNDIIDGNAVCVEIDLETQNTRAFNGSMYHISPDASSVIGFPLELMDVTQRGYGLVAKDYNNPPTLAQGASRTEGVWKTDLKTGNKELLVSLAQTAELIPDEPPRPDGTFYFWHSKFNLQGNRIMQVQRCLFPDRSGGRNVNVFTFNADGSDIIRTYSKPVWGHGGGHPNWHPDGKHLIRNLRPDGKNDKLCKVPVDGSEPTILSETIDGGGHPTIEPSEHYIITDAMYLAPDPVVRIRLIDIKTQSEEPLCILPTMPLGVQREPYSELRLDGHPAWDDRDYKRICFQAAPEGKRQLFVAELKGII